MGPPLRAVDSRLFAAWVEAATQALARQRAAIDALNVFPVPDGDTGTNLWLTMTACQREVQTAGSSDLQEVVEAAARGALMGARGNSGVILSQLVRGFSRYVAGLPKSAPLDAARLAQALEQAARTAYRAVMRPVEGTMLTVSREAARGALRAARRGGAGVASVLEAALQAAESALRETPRLLPVLAQAGVVDAGGQGLVVMLQGIRELSAGPAAAPAAVQPPRLQRRLALPGDSLPVVGDEILVRCHLHTNRPGRVLEVGLGWGERLSVSVSSMREQNRQAAARSRARTSPADGEGAWAGGQATAAAPVATAAPVRADPAPVSVVAVCSGGGLAEIFRSLGVEQVVEGGRTMNPSTQDLAAAVDRARAESVLLLPNHPNVIPAASRVHQLTSRRVRLVPTGSVPQGLAAALAFSPERSFEENAAEMEKAARRVASGEITYAVRDSELDGHSVHAGELVGMAGGRLVSAGPDLARVAAEVARHLLQEGRSLLTLYYGEGLQADGARAVAEALKGAFPDVEVEVYHGGQPLYYLLLAAE